MPLAEPGFLAVAGAAWLLSFALHSTFLLGLTALLARRRLLRHSYDLRHELPFPITAGC